LSDLSSRIVVKRAGHEEPYDERKLYASVYAAVRASGAQIEAAETLAQKVVDDVTESFLSKKKSVTSKDIHSETAKRLHALHGRAHYLYQHHRLMH